MEVRVVTPALVAADPGEVVTFSFRITSRTEADEEFVEAFDLPEAWQTVTPAGSLTLGPAEATTRLLAVTVPRSAPAGSYEMTYGVRSQRDYAIQDSDSVTVDVVAVREIALITEESPETTIAGDEYQAKLRVMNQGNAEVSVKLTTRSANQYAARVEPERLTLAPRATHEILLTVKTEKQVTERLRHVCQVVAQTIPAPEGEKPLIETISVDILPRAVRKFDPYHRIPAKLTARALGGDRGGGLQLELAGEGSLTEAGVSEVEFLLRGPDTQGASFFGKRDEYRLGYSADDFSVLLGDHTYELSRLTDYAQYGRGIGFTVKPAGRAELGAHYVKSRWYGAGDNQLGAYVSSYLGRATQLKVNFLRRTDHDITDTRFEDTLWSVESRLRPMEGMQVELEYGQSDSTSKSIVHDDAYRLEIDGAYQRRFRYTFSKIHAGPDYRGSYRDSDYMSGSVSIPLIPGLRGHASYQAARCNLDLRTDRSSAPEEGLRRFGLHYALPSGAYVSLDHDDMRYRDLLPAHLYDCEEDALAIGIGRSGRDYNVRASIRLGTHHDLLTEQRTAVQSYSLYGSYRPSRRLVLTLYAATGSDRVPAARLLVPSENVGLSAVWEPDEHLDLSLNYLAYGGSEQGDQADFCATYEEPDETTWALRARRIGARTWRGSENAFELSYTRPVSLPASRKTSIGILRGTVYDAEDPDRQGIPRAALSVADRTATTDGRGQFVFDSLPPGTHSISVERDSIGLDRTTTSRLPLEAEVAAGQVTSVDIGVVTAARVSGSVVVGATKDAGDAGPGKGDYVVGAPEDEGNLEPGSGLPNVLVELADGEEVHRRVTDARGRFLFDSVRPGRWRLKVYDYNLPPFHALESPETTIALQPADSRQVTVNVIPRRRKIQMIDTGEPEVITTEPAVPQPGEDEQSPGAHGADQPHTGTDQFEPPSAEASGHDEEQRRNGRKILPPLSGTKLIDRRLLRPSPGPGAHGVDEPPAGTDRAEPPSAEAPPRSEKQQRNGRRVLPPLGGTKLIDRTLLRPSPGP